MKVLAAFTIVFFSSFIIVEEKNISKYLNKTKTNRELKDYLNSLGAKPDDVYESPETYYDSYYEKGISFNFTYEDRLIAIFVYSDSLSKFKEYNGDLPYGLNFNMTRKDIEKLFGTPEYKGELNFKNSSWVIYRKRGFGITYNNLEKDSLAKIRDISFQLYK